MTHTKVTGMTEAEPSPDPTGPIGATVAAKIVMPIIVLAGVVVVAWGQRGRSMNRVTGPGGYADNEAFSSRTVSGCRGSSSSAWLRSDSSYGGRTLRTPIGGGVCGLVLPRPCSCSPFGDWR